MPSHGRPRSRMWEFLQRLKLRLRRVWLHWDRYPKDGTRDHPFCGIIEIRGWALALDGVRSIEIHCDGKLLGNAAIGLRRRDVVEMFPYVRGSRRSGFQYVLDTTRISNGLHEFTITGRSIKGRTARFSAPVFVKNLATRDDRYRRQTSANAAALRWMRRNQQHLPYRPGIGLIVRVSPSGKPDDLARTIRALSAQVYNEWRLHIAADSQLNEKTRTQLVQWTKTDDRISLNEPSSDCEWFGVLDAGDILTPDALFEMVYYLNRRPDCDFLYSDEASARGVYLKPDWSGDFRQLGHFLGRLWLTRLTSPTRERGSLACASGLYFNEESLLHNLTKTPQRVGHVRRILCHRSLPIKHPGTPPPAQPVVVIHAPCPLIDLEAVRSILIVKLDHLGDVLLTIPAMRRLRELCPEARITALVGSWARPLVESEPCIDEVLTYDFFAASSARNCRRLDDADYQNISGVYAGRRFDLAVDLRREADTREFLKLSGATQTVGYANRSEHDWLTIAIPWDDVNAVQPPRRHVALDALRLVEQIAMSARADVIEDYRLGVPENDEASQLLTDKLPAEPGLLVGLHPGAGRAIKCWPAERFAELSDRLIDELGATVVLFGTDADAVEVAKFMRHVRRRDRLISLVNQLRLTQFMGLLKRLDFFIGNDSGPTHMAASSGIPTLGVYAATIDACQWAPLGPQAAVIQKKMQCSPCYLAKKPDCPYGVACLQEISVNEVWEAAMRVLLPKWGTIPRLRPTQRVSSCRSSGEE